MAQVKSCFEANIFLPKSYFKFKTGVKILALVEKACFQLKRVMGTLKESWAWETLKAALKGIQQDVEVERFFRGAAEKA